jgi:hypothetical protein
VTCWSGSSQQLQRVERLREEALGPDRQRGHARLARAADHDDRHRARAGALAEPFAVEEAVDARKADVEHDRVRQLGCDDLLGLDHVAGLAHLDAFELERLAKQMTKQLIVVDDQYGRLPHDGGYIGADAVDR